MEPQEIVGKLNALGAELHLENSRLVLRSLSGSVPESLRKTIRENRQQIISFLISQGEALAPPLVGQPRGIGSRCRLRRSGCGFWSR